MSEYRDGGSDDLPLTLHLFESIRPPRPGSSEPRFVNHVVYSAVIESEGKTHHLGRVGEATLDVKSGEIHEETGRINVGAAVNEVSNIVRDLMEGGYSCYVDCSKAPSLYDRLNLPNSIQ
jgi:hypothetical protein